MRSVRSDCMGCGIEPRKIRYRRGREFLFAQRQLCGTATRGAVALPGSKATSRAKGLHRKLGGLASGRQSWVRGTVRIGRRGAVADDARTREVGPCHSSCEADKKTERSAAELVEPRAGTKGNAGQLRMRRTPSRVSVTQDVGSHTATYCRHSPRWEPYAGKPPVRICAGGAR